MITDSFPCLFCLWKEKETPCLPPLWVLHLLWHNRWPLIGPFHFCSCSFTFSLLLWQICFTLSINYFLHSYILFSISFTVPLSKALLHCGIEGPTCKQFPHKIKLSPIPFHSGPQSYLCSCLLQVLKLARTQVNGSKSLTNLSNSCLQTLSYSHILSWLFILPA